MSFDSNSGSENENEYEFCCARNNIESVRGYVLPFEAASLEKLILTISDNFYFRVVLSDERLKGAVLVTSGLAVAGSLIGRHYAGNWGAAVGGAVGGACGLGIVAVSMRDIWEDIKGKLADLFDLVYDYLAGLGIDDYKNAAILLTQHPGSASQLAMIILETVSKTLGKQVLSSLSA